MKLDTSRRVLPGGLCKELAPGVPYFTVNYQKHGVNLPDVKTLVYLGSGEVKLVGEEQPQARFWFQYAWSYQEDGNWLELPEEQRKELSEDGAVFMCPEEMLGLIADIDGVLVLLGNLREKMRRGWGWERVLPPESER